MTTIVCNREIMAADSRRTSGSFAYLSTPKITRVGNDLVGTCGSAADGEKFIEWYRDQTKKKPKLKDFQAIVLTGEGAIFEVWEDLTFLEVIEPFFAVGSGREFAMGAMAMKDNPRKAIEIACKYDKNSGLPVQLEKLDVRD